jgi:hypothetical protein
VGRAVWRLPIGFDSRIPIARPGDCERKRWHAPKELDRKVKDKKKGAHSLPANTHCTRNSSLLLTL